MRTHPGRDASAIIQTQQNRLAESIVDRQYQRQPDLTTRYGPSGRERFIGDVHYHLAYLTEAMATSSPALFTDYVAWSKVLLSGLNIPVQDLIVNLEIMRTELQVVLPPDLRPLVDIYVSAGLQRLHQGPAKLPSQLIVGGTRLASLAERYLQALLQGQRHTASQLIMDAFRSGVAVKDIYLEVFQPSQHEIGRLWQMNQINVAQEHYCTAATQLIMSQLYPAIVTTPKTGKTLVAACVGGELHEIGIRMVADLCEIEGWDTHYLGSNMPAAGIVETMRQRKAMVLGISVTMTFHIHAVVELIRLVRAVDAVSGSKILVGGYPFNVETNLWQKVGADAYAPDAATAVGVANRLAGR